MAPGQWDPFRELEEVSDWLNRMLTRPTMRTSNNKETIMVASPSKGMGPGTISPF